MYLEGKAWVLGKDVSNSEVSISVGKILPFEISSDCKINTTGGESWLASCYFAGTSIWKEIIQRIFFDGKILRTILIVGSSDTGKSTFGQGDLAPPNAIGGAPVSAQITDLREVNTQFI